MPNVCSVVDVKIACHLGKCSTSIVHAHIHSKVDLWRLILEAFASMKSNEILSMIMDWIMDCYVSIEDAKNISQ